VDPNSGESEIYGLLNPFTAIEVDGHPADVGRWAAFGGHDGLRPISFIFTSRIACPCCGYQTLYDIQDFGCVLCDWRYVRDAEVICVAIGVSYSISEARENFRVYRTMYAPDRDPRTIGARTRVVHEAKGQLMAAFDRLKQASADEFAIIESEIVWRELTIRRHST
jgi:hypothetical protein